MYKIAVLGAYDSIYGFSALGLDIFPVSDAEAGGQILKKLVSESYALIYITEALGAQLTHEIEAYKTSVIPMIVPIPGILGNTGAGLLEVRRSVEKAVGADILFSNDSKAGE